VIKNFVPRRYVEKDIINIAGQPSFQNDPDTLTKAITEPIWEILDRGGKRWRCTLVFLVAEVLGKSHETVTDFLPITEIIHNGTLVIDDIEDNSEVRRGKPCLHLVYRPDVAINVGNAMYFLPLTILAKKRGVIPDDILLNCYELCIAEMTKLHFGQGLDIWWHSAKEDEPDPTVEQYLQMCAYKTGTLARMSAKLSALVCNASPQQVEAIGRFAESIGVAFQIQDDILNIVGEKFQKESKGVGEDIHEGKRTLMVLHAFRNASPAKAKRLRQILMAHPPMEDQKTILEAISIIKETGSIEYAQQKAKEIVRDAWKKLDSVIPENLGKQKLKAFADYLIERDI
jgi:geranylgeranyl pyrophosphate synthase